MDSAISIVPLTENKLNEAIDVVLRAELDTREEIEHHLNHIEAHFVAQDGDIVIGVIGWYQDAVNYANEAMGEDFPGKDAYWVGFFAVDKEYQRKGIGKALLLKLEEVVKAKGTNALWVSSVPETRSYYEMNGFLLVREGEINGNKKFFMVKDLN